MSSTNTTKAVEAVRSVLSRADDHELQEILDAREEVLARYGQVFSSDHVPGIGEDEFRSFLLFENNKHWPLHRQGPRMLADIDLLRDALVALLDETAPIEKRLSHAIAVVPGMGRAAATAILMVAYPTSYAVWNNTSEGALKELGLWPQFERGASVGKRYVQVNSICLELAEIIGIDPWTLDAVFWRLVMPLSPPETAEDPPAEVSEPTFAGQGFGLERHLHEFLRDNWGSMPLAQDWLLHAEEGNDEAGFEYPCGVGRIDLLARHRTDGGWLVIELKRGQTSDQTIGQVLRYMGWVRTHVAESDERVRGLIIAREADDALRYALSTVPDVDLRLYEVKFSLLASPGVGE